MWAEYQRLEVSMASSAKTRKTIIPIRGGTYSPSIPLEHG